MYGQAKNATCYGINYRSSWYVHYSIRIYSFITVHGIFRSKRLKIWICTLYDTHKAISRELDWNHATMHPG